MTGDLLLGPAHSTGDGRVVFDVLEGAEDGPQLSEEVAVVVAVVVTDDGLDSLGGLVSLVEGDLTAMRLEAD